LPFWQRSHSDEPEQPVAQSLIGLGLLALPKITTSSDTFSHFPNKIKNTFSIVRPKENANKIKKPNPITAKKRAEKTFEFSDNSMSL
jgi:hypothetical protein